MDSRAEVVQESRQGQRKSAGAATSLRLGFEDVNLQSCLRQNNGRRQTVGAGSDDNRSSLGCGHSR
jgi:hypothetical protein